MIASKKDLFLKIYNDLIDNAIIEENNGNFINEISQKEEFIRVLGENFKEYYILDEWENFCCAEQEVLEELKKSIEQ